MKRESQQNICNFNQIQSVFEKNGFKIHSTFTKNILKQILNKEFAKNSSSSVNPQFNNQIFQQLWSQTQILSDGTVKVQNFCEVVHEAMKRLDQRIRQLGQNKQGTIYQREETLKQLKKEQKQIFQYIQFGYQNEQEQLKLNSVRKQISRQQAILIELKHDRQAFKQQLEHLKLTFKKSQQKSQEFFIPAKTKQFGHEARVKSDKLQWIFNFTVISFVLELIIIIYRVSFLSLLTYCSIIYLLFLGYYNDNTTKYILVAIVLSIIFDEVFIVLSLFTSIAIAPEMYKGNQFLKIIIFILILVTTVSRVLIIKNLLSYLDIPKDKQYFNFWGEEVILNKRSKNLLRSKTYLNYLDSHQLQKSIIINYNPEK